MANDNSSYSYYGVSYIEGIDAPSYRSPSIGSSSPENTTVTVKRATNKQKPKLPALKCETDDRFEEGEETIELYVKEVPEECDMCPFYTKNVNKDKLEEEEEDVFYCILRADLVSAQYGGVDVAEPKKYICPLKPLEEAELIVKMNEDLDTLWEAVFGEPRPHLE